MRTETVEYNNGMGKSTKHKEQLWQVEGREQSVRLHGDHELEFRFRFPVGVRETKKTELYFFLPPGLKVPSEHLDPKISLGHMKLLLHKDVSPHHPDSTVERAGRELAVLMRLDKDTPPERLLQPLCQYTIEMREYMKCQDSELDKRFETIRASLAHYRKWASGIFPFLPQDDKADFCRHVDRYLSTHWALFLFDLHDRGQEYNSDVVRECLSEENEYRSREGYPPVMTKTPISETLEQEIYTHNLEKKLVESVFHLQARPRPENSAATEWIAMAAAFLAMFFFTAVMTVLSRHFHLPIDSTLYILLAILLYVGKDRIKEQVRVRLARAAKKDHADRMLDLYDGAIRFGISREHLEYKSVGEMSDAVLKDRFSVPDGHLQFATGRSAQVMHYLQKMEFSHSRPGDTVEIARFDIGQFLDMADSPEAIHRMYDPENDSMIRREVRREYRFHLLIMSPGDTAWRHFEITATRDGLFNLRKIM